MTRPDSSYPDGAYLDSRVEGDVITRISRAEGHLRSIKRMLAEREDCTDILVQLAAVQAAIRQITIKILNEHVDSCVSACVEADPDAGHDAIGDLKRVISALIK